MSLEKKLQEDIIQAMKAKEAERLNTLRMVKSAIMNLKIQKKKEDISDSEVLDIFQKQVKLHRESLESFQKAGRKDLADKEQSELQILSVYLPKQLNDDEIKEEVEKAIQSSGAKTKADQGQVMKVLMPVLKGKADGKRINQILMGLLQ